MHEIFSTSLSIIFEDEKATDLSGVTREVFSIFFSDVRERFFEISIVFQGLILRLVVHYHALKILCSQPWGK